MTFLPLTHHFTDAKLRKRLRWWWKRIFGQEFSKPVLLTFLNSLLEGERRIVDLHYFATNKIGLTDSGRSLIYDILCETETGEQIIVEMHNKGAVQQQGAHGVPATALFHEGAGRVWEYI